MFSIRFIDEFASGKAQAANLFFSNLCLHEFQSSSVNNKNKKYPVNYNAVNFHILHVFMQKSFKQKNYHFTSVF